MSGGTIDTGTASTSFGPNGSFMFGGGFYLEGSASLTLINPGYNLITFDGTIPAAQGWAIYSSYGTLNPDPNENQEFYTAVIQEFTSTAVYQVIP